MNVRYLDDLGAAVHLRNLVGEVGLLKARGAHPLVGGGVRAWWGVWRVEARLDQSFARFWRDHRLQLPGGKRVHMSRLTGNQQQHLSTSERGQLVGLQEGEQIYQHLFTNTAVIKNTN